MHRGYFERQNIRELDWESLNNRRWNRCLVLFFKFINNLAPEYTRHPIPQIHRSKYALRKQAVTGQLNARTERFALSFYPSCLRVEQSGSYLGIFISFLVLLYKSHLALFSYYHKCIVNVIISLKTIPKSVFPNFP